MSAAKEAPGWDSTGSSTTDLLPLGEKLACRNVEPRKLPATIGAGVEMHDLAAARTAPAHDLLGRDDVVADHDRDRGRHEVDPAVGTHGIAVGRPRPVRLAVEGAAREEPRRLLLGQRRALVALQHRR